MPHVDPQLRQRMLAYYDERAPEYEEAYTQGRERPRSPTQRCSRRKRARWRTSSLVSCTVASWTWRVARRTGCLITRRIVPGSPCSTNPTGCWPRRRAKASRLGILARCDFVQGDFFEHDFPLHSHDTALVGFLLSHLTEDQERVLFDALRILLDSSGRFLILDSAWSPERAKFNSKVERQPRQLNDGTPFEIYKRYCDRDDISRWAQEHDVVLRIEHFGPAFYAVSGTFSRAAGG